MESICHVMEVRNRNQVFDINSGRPKLKIVFFQPLISTVQIYILKKKIV